MLTDELIKNALSPFQVVPSCEQILKIRAYVEILLKWNQQLNLTSIIDPAEIVSRHFGESMYACALLPVENGRLADVGTGAGFPGLALKLMAPKLKVDLIESNKKKCAFLSEVIRALDLSDVQVRPVRFEIVQSAGDPYNYITARAVGAFPDLLRWAKHNLSPRGHVILWVGGEDTRKILNIPSWIWQPAAKIPESQRRFILIGRSQLEL